MWEEIWTIQKILKWSENFLKQKGVSASKHDAEYLLAFALGLERLELYLRFDQPLEIAERQKYKIMLLRRAKREPLQYITGEAWFMGERYKVSPQVLIPRYDTETLAVTVLQQLSANSQVAQLVDVGTGSGVLPISIAKKTQLEKIYALDISEDALSLAKKNAELHGVADKIEFLQSDLLAALIHQPTENIFLISNPPYIAPDECLEPEVKNYEPRQALIAEDNGLVFYKKILAQSTIFGENLRGVFFEVGHTQAGAVSKLMETRFGASVETVRDIGGNTRVVYTLLS